MVEDTQPVDENAIIIDSLARRVAQLAVEAAEWRARAMRLMAEGDDDDTVR